MTKVQLVCKDCGQRTEAYVLDKGEAEEKRLRPQQARCPRCGSADLRRA